MAMSPPGASQNRYTDDAATPWTAPTFLRHHHRSSSHCLPQAITPAGGTAPARDRRASSAVAGSPVNRGRSKRRTWRTLKRQDRQNGVQHLAQPSTSEPNLTAAGKPRGAPAVLLPGSGTTDRSRRLPQEAFSHPNGLRAEVALGMTWCEKANRIRIHRELGVGHFRAPGHQN